MAKTRHGQKGIGVRPYLGFSPKSPASGPKAVGQVTRLVSFGIGGRRRKAGKGIGPFTRLVSFAIGGKRVAFEPKTPAIPPDEKVVTRLLSFGIGGKRVSFLPKSTIEDSQGGAKKVRKVYTPEEIEGMEAFEQARQGQVRQEVIDKIVTPDSDIITILPEKIDLPILDEVSLLKDILDVPVSQDIQLTEEVTKSTELDIGLILAIWTAHNN